MAEHHGADTGVQALCNPTLPSDLRCNGSLRHAALRALTFTLCKKKTFEQRHTPYISHHDHPHNRLHTQTDLLPAWLNMDHHMERGNTSSRPHYLSLDFPLLTPQAGTPSTDKKEPAKPKDPLTLRLDALDAKYKKDATQVSGTLKNINEKFEKQEVRVKVVERVKNDLSSLMARMVSVEKGVSDKKTAGSQATMNSEMITQALNRIKVLEDKEKATTGGKDAHPVTKLLLGYRSRWKEMGFENVGRLEKFANDVRPPPTSHTLRHRRLLMADSYPKLCHISRQNPRLRCMLRLGRLWIFSSTYRGRIRLCYSVCSR